MKRQVASIVLAALAAAAAISVARPAAAGQSDFIVGGYPVTDLNKEAPWQVALLKGKVSSPDQFCGGSIVAPEWILTAAHCVDNGLVEMDPANVDILAGTLFLSAGGMRVDAAAIHIHPGWGQTEAARYDNDAALIRLKAPLTVGAAIALDAGQVQLPPNIMVSGWGAIWEGGPGSNHLLRVEVPVVAQDVCDGPQGYSDGITDNMICLGEEEGGKDSCQGDSGGPAAAETTPALLVGIVSWGKGCARPKLPGVYTRVSSIKVWVEETMAANK
jgi:secreted trypsin-like serine protease